MNPKFRSFYWYFIGIWFIVFAVVTLAILLSPPILDICIVIVFTGIISMIYCAAMEDKWFPEGDEEP